jgi:myo-inositol 2-dehydrogenase / D-chiro-inositol 1-dehydrogenase
MTRLGVAVLGCGFQGAIHARNVMASERTNLVTCVDVDGRTAGALATELGVEASDDVPALWVDSRIDVVVIATTTHTHHDLAIAAADAGKHMLLEKPMAMTVDECMEIEEACDRAGVTCVVGYKFRFTDAVVAAREAVQRPRVLVAQTLYDPLPADTNPWVNDRAMSGGRLVSSLVHAVDLLCFLADDDVVRVQAEGSLVSEPSLGEPDSTVATLRFRQGAIGSIVHGTAAASGLLSTWSFQATDAGVNATIHDHGRRLTLHRAHGDDAVVVDPVDDAFAAGTRGLFEALVSVVLGEDVDAPGPRAGTTSLLVSRCIEEAIETGQPVDVPVI